MGTLLSIPRFVMSSVKRPARCSLLYPIHERASNAAAWSDLLLVFFLDFGRIEVRGEEDDKTLCRVTVSVCQSDAMRWHLAWT